MQKTISIKKCSFLFVFVAITLACNAQFKDGYIVTNDNTQINGQIRWQGSINNSDNCEFRLKPGDDVQVYKPGEIKAFRFNDSKYFSSMEVVIDNEPKTIFLEWLIKGRVSILEYKPSVSETRYFLLTEDNSFIELINSYQDVSRDGTNYLIRKQEYKNTLLATLSDCPTLKPDIELSFLNSNSLINIAKEYHAKTCDTWDCIIYEARDEKLRSGIGISGSYMSSNLILNTGKAELAETPDKMGFGFALKLENLPAISPRFSAKLNIMMHSAVFRYDTTILWSSDPVWLSSKLANEDRMFEVKYFRIPFQVSYNFTQKKINPYVSLGATMNIRYSYKKYSQFLIDYALANNGLTLGSKISLFQFGLNSGAGIEIDINPDLSFNVGYDCEYLFRFFGRTDYGTTVNDWTKLVNHHVYISSYYYF